MAMKRKRVLLVATFIIIAAIVTVICVNYFTGNPANEYDGTLVRSLCETRNYL